MAAIGRKPFPACNGLAESVVVIKGGASNKAFLLELLSRPEVQSGEFNNGWLDHLASTGKHISRHYADVAIVQAAIESYDAQLAVEQRSFMPRRARRPQVRSDVAAPRNYAIEAIATPQKLIASVRSDTALT